MTDIHYDLQRDSHIFVYRIGGFTGGFTGLPPYDPVTKTFIDIANPCDVTLDRVPDDVFHSVSTIFNQLHAHAPRGQGLDMVGGGGDTGYYVEVGDKDAPEEGIYMLFKGGYYSKTPAIVEKLAILLTPHSARKEANRPWGSNQKILTPRPIPSL